MLVIFEMVSLDCFAQNLQNIFGLGICSDSFARRMQSDLNQNSGNESLHVFNSVYVPTSNILNYLSPPKSGFNRMTKDDEIIEESVRLKMNKIRKFPENTQPSPCFYLLSNVSGSGVKIGFTDDLCLDLLTTILKGND